MNADGSPEEDPSSTLPADKTAQDSRTRRIVWIAVVGAAAIVIAGATAAWTVRGAAPEGTGSPAVSGSPSGTAEISDPPSPGSSTDGALAACTPTTATFVRNDPMQLHDMPAYRAMVPKTEIPFAPVTPDRQLVDGGYPSGQTVAPGVVIVKSASDRLDDTTQPWRLLAMPSGAELWRVDLPADVGRTTIVHTPARTGLAGVLVFTSTDVDGAQTVVRTISVDTGRELSSVTIAGWAGVVQELSGWSGSGELVPERDLLLLVGDESVVAVAPDRLDAPLWEAPGAWAASAGDIVLIDGAAFDHDSGKSLGWSRDFHREGAAPIVQLGNGLLFDTGDGTTLTRIDPLTGAACGAPIPVSDPWPVTVTAGFVILDPDRRILAFDRDGEPMSSLGVMDSSSYPSAVAGRFAEVDWERGLWKIHRGDGGTVTLHLGDLQTVGYDSQRLMTQSAYTGPVTAYDLDSGEQTWATEPLVGVQNWGGFIVTALSSPDRWPILVAE